MRLDDRWIKIVVTAALLALLPLAWLQYRSIEEIAGRDRQRREAELNAALTRVANEIDRDATRLHTSILRLPLQALDLDSLPARRILSIRGNMAREWSLARAEFVDTKLPAWWNPERIRPTIFNANPPALIGLTADRSWIVAELDIDALRDIYFPQTIRDSLGENLLEEVGIRVVPRRENSPALWASSPEVAALGRPPDAAVPALRALRFRPALRKGPIAAAQTGIWMLQAFQLRGSIEDTAKWTRWRNLAIGAATLLLLAGALLVLARAARRARRLAQLQIDFAAGVSHELRTPLAVIVSAGDNLAGGFVRDAAKVKEYGTLVRDEATRLTSMVDQVLRFSAMESKGDTMHVHVVQTASILSSVEKEMRPVAERQGADWHTEAADAAVHADAGALHTALRNLVENALRHGGKSIWIRVAKTRDHVQFIVDDDGPGIPPNELQNIFKPYFRGASSRASQRKGSGLGLALVRRIALAHGGTAVAENRPEGGARFILTVPVHATPPVD